MSKQDDPQCVGLKKPVELSKSEQRPVSIKYKPRHRRARPRLLPVIESIVLPPFQGAASCPLISAIEAPQPDYQTLAQEMMSLLRQQNSLLSSPEKFFAPIVDLIEVREAERLKRYRLNPVRTLQSGR